MKISLLIVNRDRANDLDRCLASAAAQTHRPLEVVVLDARSTDDSLAVVERRSRELLAAGIETVVESVAPAGVAASRNLAASLATGELLAAMDNDAALERPETLALAAEAFAMDERLASMAFKVLLRDSDDLDPAAWVYRRKAEAWRERAFATFTFAGGGFCLRAADFHARGGFWEALGYSREEEELCIALLGAGGRAVYYPQAAVRHYPAPSPQRDMTLRRTTELQNGLLIYWRRFPLPLAAAMCAARIAAMAAKSLFRRNERTRAILSGVSGARHIWREGGHRRRPVNWRGAISYLRLQIPGPAYHARDHAAGDPSVVPRRVEILGCPFDAVDFEQSVARILAAVRDKRRLHVVTGNVDFVVKALADETFRKELWEAGLNVADGVPVLWAAKLLGTPLRGRVNGTDLVERLAALSPETGLRIAFVGGEFELSRRAADRLRAKNPGAAIIEIETPFPLTEAANEQVVAEVRRARAEVVLVALGAPRQERWICANLERSGAFVGIGIGSAFDILSGDKPRAPRFMQRAGFEWLHRMFLEPGRLARRYLVDDMPFFAHLGRALIRRLAGRRRAREHEE